jgi:hypothetical protein
MDNALFLNSRALLYRERDCLVKCVIKYSICGRLVFGRESDHTDQSAISVL